ncbi:unnamed protein product [Chrysodeixis includens]|uniref:Allatostatin CC n=1 Tax=Chrysodeixis includens TaxID=689277 RepID=A0A9P0BQZ9_CHRIL|nr:unnamed protein product [Chrysodeixis includens]
MMTGFSSVALLLLVLSGALAASAVYNDDTAVQPQPQKRAALVLDRLLVALQKALRDDSGARRYNLDPIGPRTAPLRVEADIGDLTLLRRDEDNKRGKVIQCYFNPVTCF